MKGKIIFVSLVIVLFTSMVISGCQAPAPIPAPTPAPAPTPELAPIKIGHLRPLTGHMAVTGERMVKAFDFGFSEVNYEVAGRKIQIIVEDDASDPAVAVDKARKLVEQDKVAMIVGPTVGGTQMAVASYLNKVGMPNIHTNPSPVGIITAKFKWTIQESGAETQIASCMGKYAYDGLGLKKVTIITADWAPGHGFLNAFMDTFKKSGGQIIQEQYPPVQSPDFASYLTALKPADACVAWFDGADAIKFLSQYYDFGIWDKMPLVAAFHGSFFAPFIIKALPEKAAEALIGKITPTPYSPLLDFPENKRFVEAFRSKYGYNPEDMDSGPYQGALIAIAALKATNGDTAPEKLRQAILDTQVMGPEGPISFDKEKMSAIKNIYIVKVDKRDGEFIWVPIYTYKDVSPLGL